MSPLDNLINGYMDEAADPRSNISVIMSLLIGCVFRSKRMLQMPTLAEYPMTYRSIPDEYDLYNYILPEKRSSLFDALKEF